MSTLQKYFRTISAALCIFSLAALTLQAANVRNYMVNRYTGLVDTNYLIITPISSNILSSGGVIASGLSKRTPYSPYTNTLGLGFYSVTNPAIRAAYVINVDDAGATLYDATNLLHSGFNTYVTRSVTSNEVVTALGFVPGTGSGSSSTLWTSGSGVIYPSGSTGTESGWTSAGGAIYPE